MLLFLYLRLFKLIVISPLFLLLLLLLLRLRGSEAQRLRGSEAQRLRGSEAQRLRGSEGGSCCRPLLQPLPLLCIAALGIVAGSFGCSLRWDLAGMAAVVCSLPHCEVLPLLVQGGLGLPRAARAA